MMQEPQDITTTLFVLPPDAKLMPVSELSARLQSRIGYVDAGQSVVTRPGFRMTTRLVPGPLAELIQEFREPSLLTHAVLRFSKVHRQDPIATLDLAFDALATLVEARILVPYDSSGTQAPVPSLGAGQEFAGYEIESLVRSLEDTEVYRARHANGEAAALKISRENRQAVSAILENEARILALLNGADSPELLEYGISQERAFIAMEWCDGVSIAIAAQQARTARNRRQLHRIVTKMLEAYGRLHARGVLHGDIHTGNCLLRDDGRIVILDFGNARPIQSGNSANDPLRTGIPQFYDPAMASALLAGNIPPAASAASEQYAISVLAYLLLSGLHPVETSAIQKELLRNIIERHPLPFAARGVAAWPDVEAVIKRGLAKQEDERFRTVAELAGAFAQAGRMPNTPRRWPDAIESAFQAMLEETRDLQPSAEDPFHRAWFAWRAALALDDAVLLAAAGILAEQTGEDWTAQAIAARIARARSDAMAERQAIERFLAAVEPLTGPSETAAALLAAAEILESGAFPGANAQPLANWASKTLDRLLPAAGAGNPAETGTGSPLLMAALILSKTGIVAVPPALPARLEALGKAQKGNVWLWSLAYDVFALPQFKILALTAKRPKNPAARGFALLRLHQLTGETRWITGSRHLIAKHTKNRPLDKHLALLMIELQAPEHTVFPSFLYSSAIPD